MQNKLIHEVQGLNSAVKELTAAINVLIEQVRQLNEVKTPENRIYKMQPSGKRVHSKIESLGLAEKVIELLNKGQTYDQIANQLGNQVNRSAVGRFAKRYKSE